MPVEYTLFGEPLSPFFVWYLKQMALLVLAIVIAFLLGRVLHESTHWFVAWLLGGKNITADVRLFGPGRVEYDLPTGAAWWRLLAINASPQIIGTALVVPYVVWLWSEGVTPIIYPVVAAFYVGYVVLGSAGDIVPAAALGDGHLWHPSRGERLLVVALGLLLMAFIGNSIHLLGDYRISLGLGLSFAALGVAGMGIKEIKAEGT